MTEIEHAVAVPADLLREMVDHGSELAELKAVLTVIRLSAQTRGPVSLALLLQPEAAAGIAGTGSPRPRPERVRHAVDAAVADGLLIRIRRDGEVGLLPSTAANRALARALLEGEEAAATALHLESAGSVSVYRPNVFALYERYVGPLTPLVAESLREAERTYPRGWIEQALTEAAEQNKRSWRYVEAILNRWEETGGPGRR